MDSGTKVVLFGALYLLDWCVSIVMALLLQNRFGKKQETDRILKALEFGRYLIMCFCVVSAIIYIIFKLIVL